MSYKDPVYGTVRLKDLVILELVRSSPLLRLKEVTQHGASVYNEYYKKRIVTRFEHSVGVMLLLKKFNRPLKEQIAGLLHDVSHTVFSHVIDFVFLSKDHDHHDHFYERVICSSEIPKILEKYNISLNDVLHRDNFPILESTLPDLCADRIDYFLRDPYLPSDFDIKGTLGNLILLEDKIVFRDKKKALEFAYQYLSLNHMFWANSFEEFLYELLAQALSFALRHRIISHDDLFLTEGDVYQRLKNSGEEWVVTRLKLLETAKRENLLISKEERKFWISIQSKIRVVDPYILEKGKIRRLSQLDEKYKEYSGKYFREKSRKYWINYQSDLRFDG